MVSNAKPDLNTYWLSYKTKQNKNQQVRINSYKMLEGEVKLSNVNKGVMIRKKIFWRPLSLSRLFLQRFRCGASKVTCPKFTDYY